MKHVPLKLLRVIMFVVLYSLTSLAGNTGNKADAVASVERRASALTNLGDQIWKFAETALRETNSAHDANTREFREQTNGHIYKAYIPDGPSPVPEDE